MRSRFVAFVGALLALLAFAIFSLRPRSTTADSPSVEETAGFDPAPKPPPLPKASPTREVPAATVEAPARTELPGTVVLRGEVFSWHPPESIAGARVRLLEAGGEEPMALADTRGDGSFLLEARIDPARLPLAVRLEPEKAGWLVWVESRRYETIDALPFERDAGRLSLHPAVEVEGRVLEVFGDVPIPAARLFQLVFGAVQRGGRADIDKIVYQRAVTDTSGSFRALVPAAGATSEAITLYAETDGHLGGAGGWDPRDLEKPVEIRLPRGDQLPRLEGRVLDFDGSPLEGVMVDADRPYGKRLAPVPEPLRIASEGVHLYRWERDAFRKRYYRATTDAEGSFSIPLSVFGTWKVQATKEGRFAKTEVEAAEAGAHEVEIRFEEDRVALLVSVSARKTGMPIARARLFLHGERTGFFTSGETDAEGRFRVGPIAADTFRITVTAPPYAPRRLEARSTPADRELSIRAELEEGCRVRGRVLDEAGDAVADADVGVGPHEWPVGAVKTQADGTFDRDGLPAREDLFMIATGGPDRASSGPVALRFDYPGETRDLGHLVLRRP